MWKDFFYFSKSERRAVLFLLTLLFVFICMWVLFPVKEEETLEQDQEGIEEIKNFLAGVHEMEERQSLQYSYDKPKKRKVVLAAFDPNSADSIDFLQRGLPPFIAHTILQYRRAGGKFRTADDFSRVYGLSSEEFKILKPYIRIAEVFRRKQDTLHAVKKMRKDTLAVYKYPEGTLVDLNEADTTELKKIPGIGSGIARMIVAYRNRLGGFYDTAQLKEVDYVNEDMLKWFKLENASIHRINANKAGLDKLRSHPYMNFYKAKVIMEYRRKKGKLKSLSQLSLYEEFTEKDLERLSYYLTFD
ncbi:MAG: helix-hairpin-helix domain-containing protein [Bacteroides sp.]|uniref:Competence protein ComEA helix-hairpin-helix repeat region n=1 Tax=Phocaeicola sartorii TaxID=671267 RepID=R9I534_9BACT|nr:helix-hairpin-helix domain-containing protein [Phocaeicola sartorii]EOS11352.1 competence protein ComEA helix-hairpin-helix repeat region [Phocaeicola sartorii]MBO5506662.1 helix-hairpin-helix domain-containing protein [Bacteroides sp.]MCR1843845.1 helix-hairpin-helix domain-containing protein [Phocaeicola sartorii]NUK97986.1 helix-hairpin-helix domain-containing protein [Phocaeicola sartorii]